MKRVVPRNSTYFWFDGQEPTGTCYKVLASTFLWQYRLINTRFPAVTEKDALPEPANPGRLFCHPLQSGQTVAILSCHEGALERANASLERVGLHARLLGEAPLRRGSIAFTITFVEIAAK